MCSSGIAMILYSFKYYIAWATIIALLKNKGINKYRRLRKFAKGVFERRIRFGAIN